MCKTVTMLALVGCSAPGYLLRCQITCDLFKPAKTCTCQVTCLTCAGKLAAATNQTVTVHSRYDGCMLWNPQHAFSKFIWKVHITASMNMLVSHFPKNSDWNTTGRLTPGFAGGSLGRGEGVYLLSERPGTMTSWAPDSFSFPATPDLWVPLLCRVGCRPPHFFPVRDLFLDV